MNADMVGMIGIPFTETMLSLMKTGSLAYFVAPMSYQPPLNSDIQRESSHMWRDLADHTTYFCPYERDDDFYIQEWWALCRVQIKDKAPTIGILYRADDKEVRHKEMWRPPYEMPSWAARYFGEVTHVELKPIHDLSSFWHSASIYSSEICEFNYAWRCSFKPIEMKNVWGYLL